MWGGGEVGWEERQNERGCSRSWAGFFDGVQLALTCIGSEMPVLSMMQ